MLIWYMPPSSSSPSISPLPPGAFAQALSRSRVVALNGSGREETSISRSPGTRLGVALTAVTVMGVDGRQACSYDCVRGKEQCQLGRCGVMRQRKPDG